MYNPVELHFNEEIIKITAQRCRERNIRIPTFAEQKNPDSIPESVKKRLPSVGLWDFDPINLHRITWKNDVKTGLFGGVNHLEFPTSITGVKARVIGLVGKYFPTGAHKVGAAFGCLVPRLITGEFNPLTHRAVWPSTGNYCRGGAFDCALLACTPVAILPAEMSQERFDWLRSIGSEVIATPGSESNVKEIYDKCWEIRNTDKNAVIFNQFDEFGNCIWHYEVTASAILELFEKLAAPGQRFAGYVSATGSAGTIGAGERLRKAFPSMKMVATEALQCPTLYMNGFGAHRIEGIGDKHVPWIHNVRNTDAVAAIDDEDTMRVYRMFNEPAGLEYLKSQGVSADVIEQLPLVGISGVCNMLAAVKTAKYFEMDEKDVIFTILTDSSEMYGSRIQEMNAERGPFTRDHAVITYEGSLVKQGKEHYRELNYWDRKALHNLKYFTWVEQQGKDPRDLDELLHPEFWDPIFSVVPESEQAIIEFHKLVAM